MPNAAELINDSREVIMMCCRGDGQRSERFVAFEAAMCSRNAVIDRVAVMRAGRQRRILAV